MGWWGDAKRKELFRKMRLDIVIPSQLIPIGHHQAPTGQGEPGEPGKRANWAKQAPSDPGIPQTADPIGQSYQIQPSSNQQNITKRGLGGGGAGGVGALFAFCDV